MKLRGNADLFGFFARLFSVSLLSPGHYTAILPRAFCIFLPLLRRVSIRRRIECTQKRKKKKKGKKCQPPCLSPPPRVPSRSNVCNDRRSMYIVIVAGNELAHVCTPRLKVALTGSRREEKRETSLQKIPQRRRDSIVRNARETNTFSRSTFAS